MRILFPLLALTLAAAPALAQSKPAAKPAAAPGGGQGGGQGGGPNHIGRFADGKAATHLEAGQTVCYAFTTALSSTPALPGRSPATLTITQRPQATRDQVAISAGFASAPGAAVAVQAETTALEFYTAQRSAFARDGKAAATAFLKARQVLARSPSPKGGTITDQFSLKGFNKAYDAINKACPAK
jgi:hypothetical protein